MSWCSMIWGPCFYRHLQACTRFACKCHLETVCSVRVSLWLRLTPSTCDRLPADDALAVGLSQALILPYHLHPTSSDAVVLMPSQRAL